MFSFLGDPSLLYNHIMWLYVVQIYPAYICIQNILEWNTQAGI